MSIYKLNMKKMIFSLINNTICEEQSTISWNIKLCKGTQMQLGVFFKSNI